MTVRFGLLGAGRIGKVHAKAISSNPKAQLVAVADAFERPPATSPPNMAAPCGAWITFWPHPTSTPW